MASTDPSAHSAEKRKNGSTKKAKLVKYMMEDNVDLYENKKNTLFGSKARKYYMILTDQPRLFMMTALKIDMDNPVKQVYKKDILMYPKLQARLTKRKEFEIVCPISQRVYHFKSDNAG